MPRPDMVTVEADVTVRDALEAALAAGYSRIPVEEDGIDDIIGIAYTKDLVRAERVGKGGPGRCATACGRPSSSPSPRRSRTSCARCRRRSSTWPSWSTSTAARPGWSRWRTCSRSWSATSSTSSTWRSRPSSACDDGSVRGQRALLGGRRRRAAGRRAPAGAVGHGRRPHARPGRAGCPTPGDSVEVDGFRLTAVDVRGRRIGRVRIEPTGAARRRRRDGDERRRRAARRRLAQRELRPGALGLRGRRRPSQRRASRPW